MTTSEQTVHPRIKWLLIAASVLVAIGGLSLVWIPYQRQMRLIEEIEAMGGVVSRYVSMNDELLGEVMGEGDTQYEWLLELVGDDRRRGFDTIRFVSLDDLPIDDAWLKKLGRLSSLDVLSLEGTQISDEGLKHLTSLSNLKELYLNNTQIGDDGMKHLAGLYSLEYLPLVGTQVTDAGVEKLQQALPDCEIYR